MPSHGVDIIDGIPVILKGTVMYAFQPGIPVTGTSLQLGTYDSATKKAIWESGNSSNEWLTSYQHDLVARSRKI